MDCEIGECKICKEQSEMAEARSREEVKTNIARLEEELAKARRQGNDNVFRIEKIDPNGDEGWRFDEMKDRTERYIKETHQSQWFPHVTVVEKITNFKLEKRFDEAKLNLIGSSEGTFKFHGTGPDGMENIPKEGFLLPDSYSGKFGKGIYFAQDSTKSMKYTQMTNKLLICEVLLGRTMKTEHISNNSLNYEIVSKMGYDSVTFKGVSNPMPGLQMYNDVFTIYSADQAIARYIVHFEVRRQKAQ